MAIDDSKLLFSSEWDIDQLVDTNTVNIPGSGDRMIVDFSGLNLPSKPVFEVQFNPGSPNRWFTSGLSSTNQTLSGWFTFYCYLSGSTIRVNTDMAGTARYFIWSDKVDY